MRPGDTTLGGLQNRFPDTSWGLISRLQDREGSEYRAGLEKLCRRYWKPVYGYLRAARGKSNEDAKDLTQTFFLWLMEDGALQRFDPGEGGFRPFLKVLLRGFAANDDIARHRQKRGGSQRILSLDTGDRELGDLVSDSGQSDPERLYDELWAQELAMEAIKRVRERCRADGREMEFRVYEEYDLAAQRPTYTELAKRLGLTEQQIKHHLFAVRGEVRWEMRGELRKLTRDATELEKEWDALFRR